MKCNTTVICRALGDVTPFTGVWIEILQAENWFAGNNVTPFTGVWIEIGLMGIVLVAVMVTPFTGVWIEIVLNRKQLKI